MLNLCIKDIMIQKRIWKYTIMYALFAVIAFSKMPESMYIMGGTAIAYIFITNSCVYDDHNHAHIMLNSLPIKRQMIIYSKYLSALLMAFWGVAVMGIIGYILSLLGFPLIERSIQAGDILGTLISVGLLSSIYFPTYYKLGYDRAKIFNMILFLVVFFVPSFLTSALKSEQMWLEPLKHFFVNLSELQAQFLIGGASLCLLTCSIAISVGIYQRKDF